MSGTPSRIAPSANSEPINAAIVFEPDGYVVSRRNIMGRHSAGRGYLKALLAGLDPSLPIYAYSPKESSAKVAASLLEEARPRRPLVWVKGSDIQMLQIPGALYVPGPTLGDFARMRQRIGANAYSLVGVTHTTATHRAMDAIADLVVAPVMPWDAVICTSNSVREMVLEVLEAQVDYLRTRFGASTFTLPELPVIPLGIHTSEFVFSATQKRESREALGIARDEIAILSVGRFNFTSKMNPFQMYQALGGLAKQVRQRLCLIQCGWFQNDKTELAMREAAGRHAEGVRLVWLDGRQERDRKRAWAAGDIFISLVDNIQETFGLTPLEGMASGMPVIASDWDGYRETVRHGVDGFLVPTSMPAAGFGSVIARRHHSGDQDYDRYCGATALTVSMDVDRLMHDLRTLCASPSLRRQMGDSGQRRARSTFDWKLIFRQYLDLYRELKSIRSTALASSPNDPPTRLDPYRLFSAYPSFAVDGNTLVQRIEGWSPKTLGDGLLSFADTDFLDQRRTERLLAAIPLGGNIPISDCANSTEVSVQSAVLALCRLAKAGAVRVRPPLAAAPNLADATPQQLAAIEET